MKRPLLHAPIAAPHSHEKKIVYVSPRTPFIAAVKRVQKLLAAQEKLRLRPLVDRLLGESRDVLGIEARPREKVYIRGAGRAIEKTLSIGVFLMNTGRYDVQFKTGEVGTVDDIEEVESDDADRESKQDDEDEDEDWGEGEVPEMRIRMVSFLEVAVTMRSSRTLEDTEGPS